MKWESFFEMTGNWLQPLLVANPAMAPFRRMDSLQHWARGHGIFVNESISAQDFALTGRGIGFTGKELPNPGSVLVAVPLDLLLVADDFHCKLDESILRQESHSKKVDSMGLGRLPPAVRLALLVLHEHALGANSDWYPWLSTLPGIGHDLPLGAKQDDSTLLDLCGLLELWEKSEADEFLGYRYLQQVRKTRLHRIQAMWQDARRHPNAAEMARFCLGTWCHHVACVFPGKVPPSAVSSVLAWSCIPKRGVGPQDGCTEQHWAILASGDPQNHRDWSSPPGICRERCSKIACITLAFRTKFKLTVKRRVKRIVVEQCGR